MTGEEQEKGALLQALRTSEERLRLALEAGRLGDFAWSSADDRLDLSPAACRIFGLPQGSHPTWATLRSWLHPEDAARASQAVVRALETRTDYEIDYRVRRPEDGREIWVAARARGVYAEDGHPMGMIGVVQDVTDRKRAEADQRFLAELAALTLPLTAPEAIAAAVARALAEHIGADRCAYAESDHEDHFRIVGDHGRGVPSIVGDYSLDDFGAEFARLTRADEPYVVSDAETDPRIEPPVRAAYRQAQIRAVISVSFRKDGRFAGGMAVHQTTPRIWRKDEVDLLRLVADRCWESLQRARAIRQLRQSEERFRTLADGAPVLMWQTDDRGAVFVNREYTEFLGRRLEEVAGMGWAEALHPDDADEYLANYAEAFARRERFEAHFRFRRADGEYRWLHTVSFPHWDPDGTFVGQIGCSFDITEIKRAEAALMDRVRAKAQVERLLARETARATLLGQVAAASRAINASLSMEEVSRILTQEARSIIGAHQAVTSLTLGPDCSQAIKAVSLSEKYAGAGAYQPKPTGGEIDTEVCRTNLPLRLTEEQLARHPAWRSSENGVTHPPIRGWLAVPLLGNGGRNLGLVQLSDKIDGEFTAEDEAILTQLAAIAAVSIENARLYTSLRDEDKRKDEFLAMLAHELRNPLAPIRTGLHLLKLAPTGPPADKARQVMERQVAHMVRLIDDLLDVSRVSRGKFELKRELLPVRAVLENAVEGSLPLVEAGGHSLTIDVADEALCLEGDLTRLAQVVSNLLNNASKYTPNGGQIHLSAGREGGQVAIRVTDTGVGIPHDMLPKVFELFTQVGRTIDRAQGGLGIGLSLVRKLVEMHGGTVEAQSEGAGKGSTFLVRLPLHESAGRKVEAPTRATPAAAIPAARRILVVDDNIDAAESLALVLEQDGHEIRTAYSGPDALEAARQFAPDLVFLDIGLPGLDGYEVAARIRKEPALSGAVLVALTGWGSAEDRHKSEEAGFVHHLTKPVELRAIQEVVGRYAGSSTRTV